VKTFLGNSGVETLFIEPGNPWENGHIGSFNARMRDELLNGELFLNTPHQCVRRAKPTIDIIPQSRY